MKRLFLLTTLIASAFAVNAQYDATLQEIVLDEYVKTGEEFSLGGTVANAGSNAITSYDVTYQINEQTPVVESINLTTPLATGETGTFIIEGLKVEETNSHKITVTLSNLNGNADENDSDNTLSQWVESVDEFVPRKVLVENFSTVSCSNCPRVHNYLEKISKKRSDFSWVVHHAGYGTDIYTVPASEEYCWFYGGSMFAPALMLDRRNLNDQGTQSGESPVFSPIDQREIEKLLDYCISKPAIVDVNIKSTYNEESRELAVEVSGEFRAVPSRDIHLHIFLTESGIYGLQSGKGDNYEHSHALRKVMTSTWGDKVAISNSNTYIATYTCTLDETWNHENMSIIAFLSNRNETEYSDNLVLNSECGTLQDLSGVNSIAADKHDVWSAGKTICIGGTYNESAVYTVDGRLVATANNAATIKVENNGIYIVVVDGTSHKVVVK